MTVFRNELRQSRISLLVWSGAISFMLLVCVIMFPEMKNEMNAVTDMFSDMGAFTQAFGMDKLNYGTLIGFYGIECGNVLGIGGAFFAAISAITVLSKEEHDHTAEFLMSHPVLRVYVAVSKLCAVIAQIVIQTLITVAIAFASFLIIGEIPEMKPFLLLHLAYFLLELSVAAVCFFISAYQKRRSSGLGIGIAALFYFLNIIKNISSDADFLEFFTPFAYAEPSEIVSSGSLNEVLLLIWGVITVILPILGVIKYKSKDLSA